MTLGIVYEPFPSVSCNIGALVEKGVCLQGWKET